MKSKLLVQTLSLAVVVALSALGCKTKTPGGVTHIPGGGGTSGNPGDPGSGVKPGDGTTGGEPRGDTTPIKETNEHAGWPENRDILQADTVHFDYDSTTIRPSEKSKVTAVADYLKANTDKALKIEGHCDERGTDEYNRALGVRRAAALRTEIVGMGIDASRIDTISFGRDKPVDTGHAEASHAKNRRGEFVVLTHP